MRIQYLSNGPTTETFEPTLVIISYFSNDTEPIIDLSKTDDDNLVFPQLQIEIATTNFKRKEQSSYRCKKSSSEKKEQRKSFRDIKEPTDPYLKALDQEVDRKQQMMTSTRRSYNSKKNIKRSKTTAADNIIYIDENQPSLSTSAGNLSYYSSPVSNFSSTNYRTDKSKHASSRNELLNKSEEAIEPREPVISTVCVYIIINVVRATTLI